MKANCQNRKQIANWILNMDQSSDKLDRSLITLLQQDARLPVAELARLLKSTRNTIQNRIHRLLDRGVIKRFTVELSDPDIGGQLEAVVLISLSAKDSLSTIAAIKRMNMVEKLSTVSGKFDLIADVMAPSAAELDFALASIRKIPGVETTESIVRLSKKK